MVLFLLQLFRVNPEGACCRGYIVFQNWRLRQHIQKWINFVGVDLRLALTVVWNERLKLAFAGATSRARLGAHDFSSKGSQNAYHYAVYSEKALFC